MGRRKGELSKFAINRGWPYQVAMREADCAGVKNPEVRRLAETLSLCPRGHTFSANDEWHRVFCFSKKEDAELFKQKFGGVWFDPKRLGRGGRWHLLKDPRERTY